MSKTCLGEMPCLARNQLRDLLKRKTQLIQKIIIKLWELSIGIHKSSPATVKFDESNGI